MGHGSRGLSPHQITPNQSKSNLQGQPQIRKNPSKSDQIRLNQTSFFIPVMLTPESWLSLCSFRFRLHVPAWRFCVSAARVFAAGARRTTAGAAVLPNTKTGPWCRSLTVTLAKTQKRLNEPNSKNENHLVNIDYFLFFVF